MKNSGNQHGTGFDASPEAGPPMDTPHPTQRQTCAGGKPSAVTGAADAAAQAKAPCSFFPVPPGVAREH